MGYYQLARVETVIDNQISWWWLFIVSNLHIYVTSEFQEIDNVKKP